MEDIDNLAHAWGYDHLPDYEAYLFLKKANATLEKGVEISDLQAYLQFEAKYGKGQVSENVTLLLSFLFPDKKAPVLPFPEFK